MTSVTTSPAAKVPVTRPAMVMLPVFSDARIRLSPVIGSMLSAVLVLVWLTIVLTLRLTWLLAS